MAIRRPTIKDVAAAAGVSRTTVSHALSGRRAVNEATLRRVREVVEELGYEPSRNASSLRSGRTGTIGLLSPAVGDRPPDDELLGLDFYMRVAAEIARRAFQRGLTVQLLPYTHDTARLRHVELDGALVSDPERGDQVLAMLRAAEVPVVTLEQDPDHPRDPWQVRADHLTGTHAVLDHFAAQGAERPALLIPDVAWSWPEHTLGAYEQWCKRHRRTPRVELVRAKGRGAGAAAAARRLLRDRGRPDAVFALAELYAPALLEVAVSRGLSVPGDLLVACGVESPQAIVSQLTTLALSPERQGAAAVDLLLDRIEGASGEPVVIAPELLVRASTLRRG